MNLLASHLEHRAISNDFAAECRIGFISPLYVVQCILPSVTFTQKLRPEEELYSGAQIHDNPSAVHR